VFLALWFPRNSLLKITDEYIKNKNLDLKQWEEIIRTNVLNNQQTKASA
jgi:hypothetical protein